MKRIVILIASLAATSCFAQDVVIFVSGKTIKGRVLRYDDSRFSILVSNEVKEAAAEEVHSVFFGIEDTPVPWLPDTNAPAPAAVVPAAPAVTAKVAAVVASVPAATQSLIEVASAPTNKPAPPPAKTEYGAAEGNFTVNELLLHQQNLIGKLVKLEFDYRSAIRAGTTLPYVATLYDTKSGLDVEFGKEPYTWFSTISEHMTYTDINWRKPKAYFVYGIVEKGTNRAWTDNRPVEGCAFQPIGRRTKKGMRGAMEYDW